MDWNKLLSKKRLKNDGTLLEKAEEPERSAFERDWDRILFSTAFRRMHDKTQVFPLPEDDVVHSRLTHSLEASSVGRSLGVAVGKRIREREKYPERFPHDVGTVVAAACLAHDIGNPPFGHSGESVIASFFEHGDGKQFLPELSDRERTDLLKFEGNAQGFRLLSRLQHEGDGGLQLTAATLATFTKYPRESSKPEEFPSKNNTPPRADLKKHGFKQAERNLFQLIAEEVGLIPQQSGFDGLAWTRHPLAFLVEAADDICYSILDIEDGVRLGYVAADEAESALLPVARKASAFSENEFKQKSHNKRSSVGYLRANAVGQFLRECVEAFMDNEPQILEGKFEQSLSKIIPSGSDLKKLQQLAQSKCYRATSVLEIELAGYEALGGLLSSFVPAALKEAPSQREEKLVSLMEQRFGKKNTSSKYDKLLWVTDYVSGMTDRYALSLFRRISGISIPGRVL
ncbi:deoxyguanosinetriphosphate triphosphohydrolase [Hyalangium gracile]|uniref:deoxyguanosinetriphosphate triphosphohydrolase n=1 Tax=Hyalangium gracile TaxID=394092 RepID=UPI001CCFF337|nr:deoxyguanosinetriphosphate triphosphohydrolase [Hyalangium gracile]